LLLLAVAADGDAGRDPVRDGLDFEGGDGCHRAPDRRGGLAEEGGVKQFIR
jgi:hypothetical protein